MPNRPKPTAIKKALGGGGHHPRNDAEPQFELGKPRRPKWLTGIARREWNDVAKQLERAGVLCRIEGKALAAYCQCYQRWVEAEEDISKNGIVFRVEQPDDNGVWHVVKAMKNPACNAATDSMRQMRAFLVEYGLTPAARTRIRATPAKKSMRDERAESYFNESSGSGRSLFN